MVVKRAKAKRAPKRKISPGALEVAVYGAAGKQVGTLTLPEQIFGVRWNADLVHQVVTGMQANARQRIAHTKDRSDVRGGGKKPWRQKGTGRARHGSTRSPIWRGGGVTHGPRKERRYAQKINKKMRTAALYAVLSQKYRDGEVLFLDTLSFTAPKARDARTLLEKLAAVPGFEGLRTKKRNALVIAVPGSDEQVKRSFSNFGNLLVEEVRNLNPLALLSYRYLLIVNPAESIEVLARRSS